MIKIKNFLNKIITFLYPNKCILCSKIIENENSFCQNCWEKIKFIQKPFCDKCSTPYENDIDNNSICINCLKNKPLYVKLRSSVVYNEYVKKIISSFKFNDKTYLKKFISICMIKSSQDILNDIDILIPVPLHKKRLLYRKYNQSLLLCNEIGKLTNKKVICDFLVKKENTIPQVKLNQEERKKNLKNKFTINKKYFSNLKKYKNKNFAIIDDVITTGSTINECIKTLNKYDINNVFAITFAKTVYD